MSEKEPQLPICHPLGQKQALVLHRSYYSFFLTFPMKGLAFEDDLGNNELTTR